MAMAFLSLLFSCLICSIECVLSSQNKPNIIYFLVDDWGYNDVGYYHNTDTETPFIDKLVREESIRLDKYYVLPECTATRCAMLTGRYPMRYGMQGGVLNYRSSYALSRQEELLSNEFQNQGYETHLVGKWHLGMMGYDYVPNQRGFDTFLGYYGDEIYYYNHDGIETSCPRCNKRDFHWNNDDWNDDDRYTLYTYTDRILNIIDDNVEKQKQEKQEKEQQQTDKQIQIQIETNEEDEEEEEEEEEEDSDHNLNPFFMYVGWQGSNTPSEAPDDYFSKYSNKNEYTDERNYFQAQATITDDLLKVIVNYLKYDANIWDNTILIVSSDNGGKIGYGDNSPLRGSKFTLWEGGVRVPAFITGGFLPNNLQGSVLSNVAVHAIDWYPTLLTAAGIKQESPNQLDGMDFWNFLISGGNSEPVLLNENARKHIIDEGADMLSLLSFHSQSQTEALENEGLEEKQGTAEEELKEEGDVVLAVFDNEEVNAIANDRYILLNVNNGECDTSYGVCGGILYNNRWKLVVGANGLVSGKDGSLQSDTCFWNRDFSISDDNTNTNTNTNEAVDCGGDYPYHAATHSCDCSDFPCLFDLENDPCEYKDVYIDYLDIGEKLTSKLVDYYSNEQVLSLSTTMENIPSDVITQLNENEDYWHPWYEKMFDYSSWKDIEFEQKLAEYRNGDHSSYDDDKPATNGQNTKYNSIINRVKIAYRSSSWSIGDPMWYNGVAKGAVIIALVVTFVIAVSGGLVMVYNRFWDNKKKEIQTCADFDGDGDDEADFYSYNVIAKTTLYGSMNNSK